MHMPDTYDSLTDFYGYINLIINAMNRHDPANTKYLYNISTMYRRWANIVQMLCKCVAFTGEKNVMSWMVTRNLRIDKPLFMVYVHVYIDGPLTQQTQNICINICITIVQRLRRW